MIGPCAALGPPASDMHAYWQSALNPSTCVHALTATPIEHQAGLHFRYSTLVAVPHAAKLRSNVGCPCPPLHAACLAHSNQAYFSQSNGKSERMTS